MVTRARSRSQLATDSDTTLNATPTKSSSLSRESTSSSTSSQNGSPNPPTPNSNKENECGEVSVAKRTTQPADEDLQDDQGDKWTLYSDEMNVHFSDPSQMKSYFQNELKEAEKILNDETDDFKLNNEEKLKILCEKCLKYSDYLKKRISGSKASSDSFKGLKTKFNGKLFDFQKESVYWLVNIYEMGINGILGDEMGLGKTVQIIAMICCLMQNGVNGPFLIVAPLSTLFNWNAEFKRFAPSISIFVYNSETRIRNVSKVRIAKMKSHDVIITSYDYPVLDWVIFKRLTPKLLVVDEGHRLKNASSVLFRKLNRFSSPHKLLLTGTPIQNNMFELWSLLHFIMPEIFNDLEQFEVWYSASMLHRDSLKEKIIQKESEKKILEKFHQIIRTLMLRRTKQDVDKDIKLPPKREIIIYTPVTKIQTMLYKKACSGELLKIAFEKRSPFDSKFKTSDPFLQKLSAVEDWIFHYKCHGVIHRHIVNHPLVICYPKSEDFDVSPGLVSLSGKMIILDKLLKRLIPLKHKIIIFSQFKMVMNIIKDYLDYEEIEFAAFDGDVSLDKRIVEIDKFNSKNDLQVFLLSTRSGGLGLNLQAADTVIFYDTDWNPQSDRQAQARCHRVGQNKRVVVYRLLCRNTFDERMFNRTIGKNRLSEAMIPEKLLTKPNLLATGEEAENFESENISKEALERALDTKIGDITILDKNLDSNDEILDRITDRGLIFGEKNLPKSPTCSPLAKRFKT